MLSAGSLSYYQNYLKILFILDWVGLLSSGFITISILNFNEDLDMRAVHMQGMFNRMLISKNYYYIITMFFRKCSFFILGIYRPVKDFILFYAKYNSASSYKFPRPWRLLILFLRNYNILNLGWPPNASTFSILFSVRYNSFKLGTVTIDVNYEILLYERFKTLRAFHPSSTLNALKSLTLLWSAIRVTKLGKVATKNK